MKKAVAEVKIRGYHLDVFGHVNNARYLEFLEEGRWTYIDVNADAFKDLKGLIFFVVNININFRSAATLGDVLEIHTRLARIGNTSGVLRQEVTHKKTAKRIVDADITFVIADAATQTPLKLEDLFEGVDAELPD